MIQAYQQRVMDEQQELAERLDKLGVFIDTNSAFERLDVEDQSLLRQQRTAMSSYNEILTKRIQRF